MAFNDKIRMDSTISSGPSELYCLKASSDFIPSQRIFPLDASEETINQKVTKFNKYVMFSILSDCLNELNILRNISLQNDLDSDCNKLPTYMSIEDRYMGHENLAEYRINSKSNNFDKLAKDINLIYNILIETCNDLRKLGKSNTIEENTRIVNQMRRDDEELFKTEAANALLVEQLRVQYENERLEAITSIEETNAKIQQLKFDKEDIYIYTQQEIRYFNKWEETRLEQNKIKCKEKEAFYETIIRNTNENIQNENRCFREIKLYFETTKNEYLDGIEYWMKKYDDEFDGKENDTIQLKAELETMIERRKLMEEKFERRKAEINDWLDYKGKKEEKEMQRAKEIYAAIRIQAWWRGVMVRKKLGPFRRKKKNKGIKNTTKGKKK